MPSALKICYVTGTRADFGLMERSLRALDADPAFDLTVLATGQHLDARYGATLSDVERSGLTVHSLPALAMAGTSGAEMAHIVSAQMAQMVDYFDQHRPDLLLLLGDRGEMVAAGLAAVFIGLVVGHFHGGERSGTVDDQFRQVVSNLAHYHFPATPGARDRLIKTGERPEAVLMLGAPGLDGIRQSAPREPIHAVLGLDPKTRLASLIFHPVVQDADIAARQARVLLEAVTQNFAGTVVVLAPNSDAGSSAISAYYQDAQAELEKRPRGKAQVHWVTHLARDDYLALVAASDVLIGNSSSGIIEAASLGTPVVNVGDRQNARERNDSVFDTPFETESIRSAIAKALAYDGDFGNLYDQGGCAPRLAATIKSLDLSKSVLKKTFTF